MQTFRSHRPDCGFPKRVLLRPGDAFIAHQRLAHAAGINLSNTPRKNVYFRIMHNRQEDMLEQYLDSPTPWKGFSGLSNILSIHETSVNVSLPKKICRPFSARPMRTFLPASEAEKVNVSDDQVRDFLKDGYIIVKDFIPKDMTERAISYVERIYKERKYHNVDYWVRGSHQPGVRFSTYSQRAAELTDLFYRSGLVDVCEKFLGRGNILIRENMTSILYRRTSEMFHRDGVHSTEVCPRDGWDVQPDGNGFRNPENDYSLFIHVVLSEGQDGEANRGHLNVWKGKFHSLLRIFYSAVGE